MSDQEAFPLTNAQPETGSGRSTGYRVLARSYRPQKFSELIGQNALVRTLSNAMQTGRIAHAFLLTGIRGVGKTTTARLIARALNCIGPDGKGEPTPEPCGQCEHCVAIADGRHIDILEMDAATHTGIDDVRELVDSVRYAPTSARYKVYIVDEVHMLSEKAFNGLLKTLEEPPPQTLFIFATTEVRKVPITVLSRCQRFDLRRIESDVIARYFKVIAEREGITIDDSALALISRAAEGSMRDGLSLMDQAIALGGGAPITALQVQDMLGLADRKRVLDLFEQVMRGRIADALGSLGDLHERGAEPEMVIQDLLEISHWLTRLKVASESVEEPGATAFDGVRGKAMAAELSIATLSRAWQMLLKGLDDLRIAPSPLLAAEMLLIRLAHAADLPTAEAMLAKLNGVDQAPGGSSAGGGSTAPPSQAEGAGGKADVAAAPALDQRPPPADDVPSTPNGQSSNGVTADSDHTHGIRANGSAVSETKANGHMPEPADEIADRQVDAGNVTTPGVGGSDACDAVLDDGHRKMPGKKSEKIPGKARGGDEVPLTIGSFAEAAALFKQRKKPLLYGWLHGRARLVDFQPGKIELESGDQLLADRRREMAELLTSWTGEPWLVIESDRPGDPSLTDQEAEAKQQRLSELAEDPRIKPVLETFPGAKIIDVQKPSTAPFDP
ncbi:MAG: DNA polymerase III subunit gamma/tau [Geminicoccaceae bacterium]